MRSLGAAIRQIVEEESANAAQVFEAEVLALHPYGEHLSTGLGA